MFGNPCWLNRSRNTSTWTTSVSENIMKYVLKKGQTGRFVTCYGAVKIKEKGHIRATTNNSILCLKQRICFSAVNRLRNCEWLPTFDFRFLILGSLCLIWSSALTWQDNLMLRSSSVAHTLRAQLRLGSHLNRAAIGFPYQRIVPMRNCSNTNSEKELASETKEVFAENRLIFAQSWRDYLEITCKKSKFEVETIRTKRKNFRGADCFLESGFADSHPNNCNSTVVGEEKYFIFFSNR